LRTGILLKERNEERLGLRGCSGLFMHTPIHIFDVSVKYVVERVVRPGLGR
jgi:hypothetical protein